jgi:hypothetical protein
LPISIEDACPTIAQAGKGPMTTLWKLTAVLVLSLSTRASAQPGAQLGLEIGWC